MMRDLLGNEIQFRTQPRPHAFDSLIGKSVYIDWVDDSDWHYYKLGWYDSIANTLLLTGIDDPATGCKHGGDTFTIGAEMIAAIKRVPIEFLDRVERVKKARSSLTVSYWKEMTRLSEAAVKYIKDQSDDAVVFMSYVGLNGTVDTLWIPGMDREELSRFWSGIDNAYLYWSMEGENLPGVTVRLDKELSDLIYKRLCEDDNESVFTGCMYRQNKCWIRGPEGHYQFVNSTPPAMFHVDSGAQKAA